MTRLTTKKIQWDNFSDTCNRMNRDPNHVLQFVATETGSECIISNNELSNYNYNHIFIPLLLLF